MGFITAVVIKPMQKAEIKQISNDLETLQALVEGYIETVNLGAGIYVVLNEEGKLEGLAPNLVIGNDILVGNVIFTASNGEGDFVDLQEHQLETLRKHLGKRANF